MKSQNSDALLIFAKAPHPGAVKTRLALDVGPEQACDIYKTLLRLLGKNLSALNATVCFSPSGADMELRPFFPSHWCFQEQVGASLGERLAQGFAQAFARDASKVVIIGSDCPEIAAGDIRAAWTALEQSDLVVGPASDGGYWLIGLRSLVPQLFEEIDWSSAAVLEQTLERARAYRKSCHLLRTLGDIDTAADWQLWSQSEYARQNAAELPFSFR